MSEKIGMSDEIRYCPSCGFEVGKRHRCVRRIADGKLLRSTTRYDEGPVGIFGEWVVRDFDCTASPVEIANAAIAKTFGASKYPGIVKL